MTDTPETVERVAKAIYEAGIDYCMGPDEAKGAWEKAKEPFRGAAIFEAHAALDALTAAQPSVEQVNIANDLIDIVEGMAGTMNHGTWRCEKEQMRLKDTQEWVNFYNAFRVFSGGKSDD